MTRTDAEGGREKGYYTGALTEGCTAPHAPATFYCRGLRVLALPDDLRQVTQPYCSRCFGPGFVGSRICLCT